MSRITLYWTFTSAPCSITGVRKARCVFLRNMCSWMYEVPDETVEVLFPNFSHLYRDLHKCVTVSEYDHEEKPVVYTLVPSDAATVSLLKQLKTKLPAKKPPPSTSTEAEAEVTDTSLDTDTCDPSQNLPQTILTCYFIQTHKGTASLCTVPSMLSVLVVLLRTYIHAHIYTHLHIRTLWFISRFINSRTVIHSSYHCCTAARNVHFRNTGSCYA